MNIAKKPHLANKFRCVGGLVSRVSQEYLTGGFLTLETTSEQLKAAAAQDGIKKLEDYVPANWEDTVRLSEDFDVPQALLAYIKERPEIGEALDSLIGEAPKEQHKFDSIGNGDYCGYLIFEDDSLWFINNAQDEVWIDYGDFIQESLISGIEACNADGFGCFTEEEYEESDDHRAWLLDGMDRELLLHYCEDENEARKLIGFVAE